MADQIRVVLADDHAIMREGIRSVLENRDAFQVVGETSDADETVETVRTLRPDVVVLDVSMPGRSGLEIVGDIRRECPTCRVLILSVHSKSEYIVEAVHAGAHGYLLKDSPPSVLRDAIATIHGGAEYFSPAVAGALSAALREERATDVDPLTPREREVLVLIAEGCTNKQAAASLGIGHRTVETHRENVMRKLGLKTVADLTRYALEHGLLTC